MGKPVSDTPSFERGILVAADQTQEWLLPWWWEHYRIHNIFPVAFADLGLSLPMKKWCREKGIYLPFSPAEDLQNVADAEQEIWKKHYGSFFWESRQAWFQKPLSCLRSPFQQTIWLDLDCEVKAPLAPLFTSSSSPRFAIAKDLFSPPLPYPVYNSGVFVFSSLHPLLQEWAQFCLYCNGLFHGDQEALSFLIAERKIPIEELSFAYNHSRLLEEKSPPLIKHWHGPYGKWLIQQSIEKR